MRRPWFSYYVDDFELDDKVAVLTNQEEGAYHRLLRFQWRHGQVPTTPKQLAGIIKETPRTAHRIWESLSECFPNGVNPRLEKERVKAQEISEKRAASAKQMHSKCTANAEQVQEVCTDPCVSQVTSHKPQTHKPQTKEETALVLVGDSKAIPEDQLSTAVAEWVGTSFTWDTGVEAAMRVAFSYWVARTGRDASRTLFTPERKTHLRARLREAPKGNIAAATSPLLYAVDGCMSSDFHVENGHTSLEQIFRNRSRLEGFAERIGAYRAGKLHPLLAEANHG